MTKGFCPLYTIVPYNRKNVLIFTIESTKCPLYPCPIYSRFILCIMSEWSSTLAAIEETWPWERRDHGRDKAVIENDYSRDMAVVETRPL